MISHQIAGRGGGIARVNGGALITAPPSFAEYVSLTAGVAVQAYNLLQPVAGFRPVLIEILFYGNKNVSSTTAAAVQVYEATGPDSTAIGKELITVSVAQKQYVVLRSPVIAAAGKWINMQTSDDDVDVVLGFYLVADDIEVSDFSEAYGDDV